MKIKSDYEKELIKAIAIIDCFPSEALGYIGSELMETQAAYKQKEKELQSILSQIEIYKQRAANYESFAKDKQKVVNRLSIQIKEMERKLKILEGKVAKHEAYLIEYGVCCDAIRHTSYLEKKREKRINNKDKKKKG